MSALLRAYESILSFYFGEVTPQTITDIAGCSPEDFDVKAIEHVSNQTNLFVQNTTIDIKSIDTFLLPLILHNGDDAVVLMGVSHGQATIIDKDKKEQKLPLKKLAHFEGKAILFFRKEQDKNLTHRTKSYDWFFRPIKNAYRSYIEVGVLSLFINIFALAVPLFTLNVYDRVVPNFATQTLFVLAGGVLIIFIFELIFKAVRVYILENTGKKIAAYLEEALLERMMTTQLQFDHLLSGSKAMLFRELSQVKEFFSAKTMVALLDLPFFIIAVVVIYLISPPIALVPLVVGSVLIIFNVLMQIPLANLAHEQFKDAQTKHGYLVETIQGRDAVKLVNASSQRLFVWRRMVNFYENLTHRIQSLAHFTTNSSYTLIQAVTLVVITIGVYQIYEKELTIGGLIAITILSSRAMVPIVGLSGLLLHLKKTRESLASINNYWHLPREVNENTQLGLGTLKGDIEFKDVTYYYQKSKYPSIEHMNLSIKAGEKVGIIGKTGAGKSTLVRLITALDVPTTGAVYLDGSDTATLHPTEVRQNIGIMPQNPFLFASSIKDNIALSRAVNKEEINRIIKLTGLDALIRKSGYGDALQVGENGENLSMGQRHLVALARALLHNPSILILDEPTTGLDIGLERDVISNLKPIVKDKTLLVITHRFSALELVDRVLVIDEGKIVADGLKESILNALQKGNA